MERRLWCGTPSLASCGLRLNFSKYLYNFKRCISVSENNLLSIMYFNNSGRIIKESR